MKLVLLVDIEQSVICVCFSHDLTYLGLLCFEVIYIYIYIYMKLKYYDMIFNFKLN